MTRERRLLPLWLAYATIAVALLVLLWAALDQRDAARAELERVRAACAGGGR